MSNIYLELEAQAAAEAFEKWIDDQVQESPLVRRAVALERFRLMRNAGAVLSSVSPEVLEHLVRGGIDFTAENSKQQFTDPLLKNYTVN